MKYKVGDKVRIKDKVMIGIKAENDPINPDHYKSHPSGIECIQVTRHMTFNIGNVIKYCWRNGLKEGNPSIQDLKKAAWYLNDEIEMLEKKNKKEGVK